MKRKNAFLKGIDMLFVVLALLLSVSSVTSAQTPTPTPTSAISATPSPTPNNSSSTPTPTPDKSKELSEINDRIQELQGKLSDLQGEEKTLSSQISVMNNQIQLTEYRIDSTRHEIDELNEDITITTEKVSKLETSLEDVVSLLIKRAVASYETRPSEPLQVLLSSESFSDFIKRINYLYYVQDSDKKLLVETQQAKMDYQNQQSIFEAKKQKVEALRVQLEEYTTQLDADKAEKEELLEITQNDERRYQSLLASARAERNAIEGVVSSIQLVDGSPISKGQVIAVVGNSGAPHCSSGPHLHFEVRKDSSIVDPNNYLRSGINFEYAENYDTNVYGSIYPSGSWDWPLSEKIRINQGYGSHSFASWRYPSGIHTGIDMTSLSSLLITSPADGTVYKGSTSCSGATMNYVAVDHGGGIVSWYWHVK